jgi:hypothetical protein
MLASEPARDAFRGGLLVLVVGIGSIACEKLKDKIVDKAPPGTSPSSSTDSGSNVMSRYAAKEKTTEAVQGIKKIYDGARAYYLEENIAQGTGTPLPQQFPKGHAGPTPPLGACCKSADHRCTPTEAEWNNDTWQALRFSMEDPHFYSYEYVSDGTAFTARALGDLDCDGEYSTFEMSAQIVNGELRGSKAYYKNNELE